MYTCEKQVSVEEMDLDALIKMEQDNENLRQKLIDLSVPISKTTLRNKPGVIIHAKRTQMLLFRREVYK